MRTARRLLVGALQLGLIAVANTSHAQSMPKMKPGAWEFTSQSNGGSAKALQEQMAKLPPQIREMMQKNMATQAAKPSVSRLCFTGTEDSSTDRLTQQLGMNIKCDPPQVSQSGSTWRSQARCSGTAPGGQAFSSQSDSTMTMAGSDAFQQTTQSRTTLGGMEPINTTTTSSAKFLGTDCNVHGALTLDEQLKAAQAQSGRGAVTMPAKPPAR